MMGIANLPAVYSLGKHLPSPLWLLALMACLPFLLPHHRTPIPSFFQEWWAGLLGLLSGVGLIWHLHGQRIALPRVAVLPALLIALILLQLAISRAVPLARPETALLGVLYLLWAVLLMAIARSLRNRHGAAEVSSALAVGLASGALLSTAIVALQWQGLRLEPWISTPPSTRLFGNINQPNHLALLLWLGVIAVIHLQVIGNIRFVTSTIAVVMLATASVTTGSRALWLYALGLPLLLYFARRRYGVPSRAVILALAAMLAALAAHFCLSLLASTSPTAPPQIATASSRGNEGIRLGLWWIGIQMGLESPFTGIGWGSFASASFGQIEQLLDLAPASIRLVAGEHAHNIVINLLAELGLPGALALLLCGFAWARRVWTNAIDPAAMFAILLLVMLVIHAQVEYTLWYSYFLGIAAIALALSDPEQIDLPAIRPALILAVLCGALVCMLILRHDYARLENAMHWRELKSPELPDLPSATRELIDLRHHSQFGRYVDLALIGATPVDRNHLAGKTRLCAEAIAFSPADFVVFKCAAIFALAGDDRLASSTLSRSLAAYPEKSNGIAIELTQLARQFPELSPLATSARVAAKIDNSADGFATSDSANPSAARFP